MTGLFELARPFLHAMDAETAHKMGLNALKTGLYPADRSRDNPSLEVNVLGLKFPNPLGIAAGFDKNTEVPDAVLNLGCGFAEASPDHADRKGAGCGPSSIRPIPTAPPPPRPARCESSRPRSGPNRPYRIPIRHARPR